MRKTRLNSSHGLPPAQGLYNPAHEHDACGIGFVASISGHKSHDIIQKGIQVLLNLAHRGACGCDPETGDGAGVLIQIPHKFFARECEKLGFTLPKPGTYGVGMTFLPVEKHQRLQCEGILERILREEGLTLLGWRDTPVYASAIGRVARASQPYIQQIFMRCAPGMDEDAFERKLYVVRKRAENEIRESGIEDAEMFYIPSLSCRTIVYKGLLLAPQIENFYRELSDPDAVSALCLVHQRFSTNTFPSWQRAHPYRYIAHNGEINTLRGNVNWMQARQSLLESPLFGDDIKKLHPVIAPDGSDSSNFDNAVELLLQSGRSLPHVMAMLIPEAWSGNPHMKPEKRAFYEYHACLMEPWDGPAAIAFTDGRVIGATLDRNGLRPGRYVVTHDDLVVMASEAGVLDIAPEQVKSKGRLQPGKMFLVDTVEGRIVSDKEIKQKLASRQPYAQWVKENQITMDQLPEPSRMHYPDSETLLRRQRAFGYSDEDLRMILGPMATKGEEPIGSMGTDTPLACLSDKPQSLFNYFKQLFAQVTNPPIDPIREEMVMSLISYIGSERNILEEAPGKLPHAEAGASAAHQPRTGKIAPRFESRFAGDHVARVVPRKRRRSRTQTRARRTMPASLAGGEGRIFAVDSFRSRRRQRLRSDSVPARSGGRSQFAGAGRNANPGCVDHRIGRAARSHALCLAERLRRQRDQSVSGTRKRRRSCLARRAGRRHHSRTRGQALPEGHEERSAEDFLEDGHFDVAELSGRAGFRSHRTEQRVDRLIFCRDDLAPGRRRT